MRGVQGQEVGGRCGTGDRKERCGGTGGKKDRLEVQEVKRRSV